MNRKSYLFVLPLIALVLMSCRFGNIRIDRERINGSGNLKTETREVSNVERVALEDIGDLTIIQGDTEGLTVEADDNILQYIETEMRGRELVLKVQDGYQVSSNPTIRYTLRVKNLNRISVAGAGNVEAESLEVGDLNLDVAGAGNVNLSNLQADRLTAETSGSGNFNLDGKVASQNIIITGAGNYSAGALESGSADVTITGAGNVTVWAVDELDIRINGFGDVSYYGSPEVSQSITGGGAVKSLGQAK